MFDQLLRDTNISIGVLNVLIGYVLVELNGQIPNYNYFLKIINTWKRAKVVSTLDALQMMLDLLLVTSRKIQKTNTIQMLSGYIE